VIELRPSVAVVAMNDQQEIVLVGQWRYPTNSFSWEVPRGGSLEGETDLVAVARRELLEETGVVAEEWRAMGDFDLCNGVLRSKERVFLATSLRLTEQPVDPGEPLESRWVPLDHAVGMVLGNEIREATSAGAILKTAALLR